MLRNEFDELNDSLNQSMSLLPLLHSEYIKKVINAYHHEKKQQSNKGYIFARNKTSQKIRYLEQFYLTLQEGTLNDEQFFEFLKIIFSKELKECDVTKSIINQILLTHVDSRIASALDSAVNRVGALDDLKIYINAIFQYPNAAAAIVYIVLILTDFVRAISKLGKNKDLFVNDILQEIYHNPLLAIEFDTAVKILRSYTLKQRGVAIHNIKHSNSLAKMLTEDVYIFVFYKMHQQNILNQESIKKIEALKLKDLEALGLKLRFDACYSIEHCLRST